MSARGEPVVRELARVGLVAGVALLMTALAPAANAATGLEDGHDSERSTRELKRAIPLLDESLGFTQEETVSATDDQSTSEFRPSSRTQRSGVRVGRLLKTRRGWGARRPARSGPRWLLPRRAKFGRHAASLIDRQKSSGYWTVSRRMRAGITSPVASQTWRVAAARTGAIGTSSTST